MASIKCYDRAKGKAFLQKSFPLFYGVQPVEDTKHLKQETNRYVGGLWQVLPEQTVVADFLAVSNDFVVACGRFFIFGSVIVHGCFVSAIY